MKIMKKRIAIFLCMLMAFTTVGAFLPSQKEVVKAEEYCYVYGYNGFAETTDPTGEIVIEKGCSNLYLGDFVMYSKGNYDTNEYEYGYLSTLSSGPKYFTSDSSIISVDKNTGKVTAKSEGVTTVSVAYKNYTLYANMRVVSDVKNKMKNALKKEYPDFYKESYESYMADLTNSEKAAKAFNKNSAKITEKNILEQMKYYVAVDQAQNWGSGYVWNSADYSDNYYIYSSECLHAKRAAEAVATKVADYNPLGTIGKYVFKIKSKKGSGDKITVELKKAVSAAQLAGAEVSDNSVTNAFSDKSTSVLVTVYESNTNNYTRGIATIVKDSKKIEIKLLDGKLKKGTKYTVHGYWNSGFEFTFKAS